MIKKPFALKEWKRRKLKLPEEIRNYIQNLRLISPDAKVFRIDAFGKDFLEKDLTVNPEKVPCACRFDRPLILSLTMMNDIELFPEINGAFSFSTWELERGFCPDEEVNTDLN